MGSTISNIFDRFVGKEEIKILMVGLEYAGKTTILDKLKLGEVVSTIPTIGFSVENSKYNNINFTSFDLDGPDQRRILWPNYYQNTQGIIYVIDSTDKERIDQAKEEMVKLLEEEELKNIPLLVFGNKCDKPGMMITEMVERLGIKSIRNRE